MAFNTQYLRWLAAGLLVASGMCQASDLQSEPRYADISRGNVAAITQIGVSIRTDLRKSSSRSRPARATRR